MKRFLFFFILIFTSTISGQCFDCSKNLGGHNGDVATGIKKTTDGIYLLKNSGNFNLYGGLIKYDLNCNQIWSKYFDNYNIYIKDLTYDSLGNIYVLYAWTVSSNIGYGPFIIEGLTMNPGLNLYKFSPNGDFIWHRFLGYGNLYNNLNNLYIYNNMLYVVSSHYGNLNVDNQYFFNFPYNNNTRPYICKVDLQSNIIDVKSFGTSSETYTASEIDSDGNIYLSSYNYSSTDHSDIEKIDSNLQPVWSKEITNGSIYTITKLYYYNNKLYTWGVFNATINLSGNIFVGTGVNSNNFQSLFGEFNVSSGDLDRAMRIDNSSHLSLPGLGNNAHMTSKGNEIYIFTSFSGTLVFPNNTITSNVYYTNPTLYSEELVLFKIDLSNFTSNFILKSYGVPNLNYSVTDAAGPILFDNNELYLTASFSSKPMLFNGSTINNNSGNNSTDVMFYKYNTLTNSNVGQIDVENTCFSNMTSFNLNGNFDTITWDFDDPSSLNNSSSIGNPSHQFSTSGSYNIRATVTCGSQSQIVEKIINITPLPTINSINPLIECEDVSGSGISSNFNTSNIENLLIGNQQNITLSYTNSNGLVLSSPLPNPYTNSNHLGDLITARVFYPNNPKCYSETTISFSTSSKPSIPTLTSPQTFCIQQNATLNTIAITGQNIKWYDAPTGGILLPNTTILQDVTTYYASQTINSCESLRMPVTIKIQNTSVPTGTGTQTFCSTQNATLSDISIAGSNINWYNSTTNPTVLSATTALTNGTTYYASQTINGCESLSRLPFTVSIINSLNANNYSQSFCDDLNDGSENVLLTDYNSNLITSTTNTIFTYYPTLLSAQNQVINQQLNSNYSLNIGLNTIYVRLESTNGCHQIVKLELTLFPKPTISINDVMPICKTNNIIVDAGAGFNSYLWSTGATTQSITITQAGNYSVIVTQNHGGITCTSIKNFTVVLSNIATIATIETQDWTDNENIIIVNLTTSSIGNYEYSLDGIHYQDSNIFSGLYSGNYTVYVHDKNECGIATKDVFLLTYPKFFTPNGDGNNDTWKIKFSQYEPGLKVKIFDRYGKHIKSLEKTSSWDGTNNGELMLSDDYWFIVTRANGKEHKGHFTLKR